MTQAPTSLTRRTRIWAALGTIFSLWFLTTSPLHAADDPGAAVVVNSTGNSGDLNPGDGVCDTGFNLPDGGARCSLRAAIEETNASTVLDRIHFNIPVQDGNHNGRRARIPVPTALPNITADTEISGSTQPGFAGVPVIELLNTGSVNTALRFQLADGAGVEDLNILRFGTSTGTGTGTSATTSTIFGAILVELSDDVVIKDNWVGVQPRNEPAATHGNQVPGIRVSGSTGTAIVGNVVGNNARSGIDVTAGSRDTTIDGNFVGLTPSGIPVPNSGTGIFNFAADRTVIGGVAGNTVALNGDSQITVTQGSDDVGIFNNSIGVTSNNTLPSAPASNSRGIQVTINSSATIGDTNRPNVIAANGRSGIRVEGSSVTISSNLIGTNSANADLGNSGEGITLDGTTNSVIRNNVIGFNDHGIDLRNDTDNITIDGNWIGVSRSGADIGNASQAIELTDANSTTIVNNIVGFANSNSALTVLGTSANTSIDGNLFGVTPGNTNIGNLGTAINVGPDSSGTTIGASSGNVLANSDQGGGIAHTGPSDVQIYNNLIGVAPNGRTPAPNGGSWGIATVAGGTAVIGDATRPNVIAEQATAAVLVTTTASTSIVGNFIGTNQFGDNLGTGGDGILISSSSSGPLLVSSNVIGQIADNGIEISAAGSPVQIDSNFIGVTRTGTGIGNSGAGIAISGNTSPVSITNNEIAFNAGDGVRFDGGSSNGPVRISQNSIHTNGQLAIDLGGDEVTLNDGGDGDSGPNGLLNYPVIADISETGSDFDVAVTVDVPNGNYTIEIYSNIAPDSSGHGEADQFIGAVPVTSNGTPTSVNATGVGLTPGRSISALLINNATGATSELSRLVTVPLPVIASPTTTQPITTTTAVPPTNAPATNTPTTNTPTTNVPTTNTPITNVPITNVPTNSAPNRDIPNGDTPTTDSAPIINVPPTEPGALPFNEPELGQTTPTSVAPGDPAQIDAPQPTPTPAGLQAIDDTFALSTLTQTLDVLANDIGGGNGSIESISQPSVGSATRAEDNMIEVTLPESFAGSITFTYTLLDDLGTVTTATVTVESLNLLSDVRELVDNETTELTSVEGFSERSEALVGELVQIRVSVLQLSVLSFAPFMLAVLYLILRARDQLVELTGVTSGETLHASHLSGTSSTPLRHDEVVWTRSTWFGRRKTTRVTLSNGEVVSVPTDSLRDTGF